MNPVRWAVLAGFALTGLGCSDDPAAFPAVAYVALSPGDTILAPGDSVWFSATAYDAADRPILGIPFTWLSSDETALRVDSRGVARAIGAGQARLEAREPAAVRAFAEIRVRPVSGFSPGNGAFGEIVRLRGDGFTSASRVYFGQAEAFVRGIDTDGRGLEAWVPVGATTGPIRVVTNDLDTRTDPSFFVTGGGDDALEPNGLGMPRLIPFPFENPSLLTRPMFTPLDPDVYSFRIEQDGPFRLQLIDRSAQVDRFHTLRAEIFDVTRQDFVALSASYAYLTERRIEPLELPLVRLRAGEYTLMISPFAFIGGFSNIAAGDRSYGFKIDRQPTFTLQPDTFEPNNYPAEAASLPFPADINAVVEFPWGADYFTFELPTRQDVWIRLSTGGTLFDNDLDLVLMSHPSKSITHIIATNQLPSLIVVSDGGGSLEDIVRSLPAGRYVIGVLDSGGVPAAYRLQLRLWPANSEVPLQLEGRAVESASEIRTLAPWAAARLLKRD